MKLTKRSMVALLTLAAAATLQAQPSPKPAEKPAEKQQTGAIPTVLEAKQSPLVTFRILFKTGAVNDPKGQEGVAALTAALIAKGGSRAMSYNEILDAMYPMATSFDSQTDKEMTVFSGTTHADNLERYYGLISQMLLDPGFREDDFNRLKKEALNFLSVTLRDANDEELGKEELYNTIYAGHPYGHHNVGRVSSLQKLTLDNVRQFYKSNYTRANLVIGLAGGFPSEFPEKLQSDFAKLAEGKAAQPKIAAPKLKTGTAMKLVQRQTRSTAISLGFPIAVNRSHADWPALALVTSYFGQHRSSNSYLYKRLREARGLNYGDYAYIEYFPRGMFQFYPDPNLARQQQIFQIWIRPVPPEQGHFALRAAMYEFDKLLRDGMSQEDFEATREFLSKYVNILTGTQDAHLGYALDSRYYGIGDFSEFMRDRLAKLTLDEVNAAMRRHLRTDNMRVVMVTQDAEGLRKAIIDNKPSPISYNSPKPDEIMEEDKIIQDYKLTVKPADVTVMPAAKAFE
jgi:zinc protease